MSKLSSEDLRKIIDGVYAAIKPTVDAFLQREANNVENMTKWHVRETLREEALIPAVQEAVRKMVREKVSVRVEVKDGN